jgi:hypothetical protein
MDWTHSASSANDGSSGARLDYCLSADEHALARGDATGHALARRDCALSADEHALARSDADGHALATLARLDRAESADEHALARGDANGHALARLNTDATPAELPQSPLDADGHALARLGAGATPAELPQSPLEPQRYKVQFEASEEYVELVERAKALSHRGPRPELGDLHLRAMRAFVAELEREKYAVTTRQRVARRSAPGLADEQLRSGKPEPKSEPKLEPEPEPKSESESESESEPPRRRGRHIPAAIRRAVFERDARRCTYRSGSGERCRETARLELHHSVAFARGGEHRLGNVTLRCRAHNAFAAEEDFGGDFVSSARDSSQHELWARHEGPCDLPKREVEGEGPRIRERWQVETETGLGMQRATHRST